MTQFSDENQNQKKSISDVVNEYKKNDGNTPPEIPTVVPTTIPSTGAYSPEQFKEIMSQETDPDLMTSYELIKLPSKGLFYSHKINEVKIEYMTSKDEDLLTTPSLIESGKVLDLLLKRKVKTPEIIIDDLLPGDRNALILFLRTSSYGPDYSVEVIDPRTGIGFKTKIDLLKLKYKEIEAQPNEMGFFSVNIPMRKKTVLFRLISSGEDQKIFQKAEDIKEAYQEEFSSYNTIKLKAHIMSINDNTDRGYIDKFVNAMPALDAYTIRRKILDVQPDVDMLYEFTAKDGYKFKATLSVGVDFFFPAT